MRLWISGKKAVAAGLAFVLLCGGMIAFTVGRCVTATAAPAGAVQVPILMYHSVGCNNRVHSPYIVTPEVFERDLRELKRRGYTAVFCSDLAAYVNGTGSLPPHPVVITLDDGYLNGKTEVLPILEKLDMKAVISVVGEYCQQYTDRPDTNPAYAYLTWEDVSALAASGRVEIGNHTYAMHGLSGRTGCTKKSGESTEVYAGILREDLSRLQDALADRGIFPVTFAYPYGEVSKQALPVLKELGFSVALTCAEKVNTVVPGEPEGLLSLGRFNRPAGETTAEFLTRAGLPDRNGKN